ncbi:MAG: hypothetical protein KGY70_07055 [Bacteroidales bacterium]|nr:hypothetical protein [Bacteroidales bacterium]
MLKKIRTLLKNHWIKITASLLAGLLIGGGIIYSIEQQQENFWREKYIQQTQQNDSLRKQIKQLNDQHNILINRNKKMKDDLGITILSSIRSNFYDLKALKSEDYNTQLYYNQQEYKSNLVPKTIGDKWNIDIFNEQYKSELQTLMDSIYKAKNQ